MIDWGWEKGQKEEQGRERNTKKKTNSCGWAWAPFLFSLVILLFFTPRLLFVPFLFFIFPFFPLLFFTLCCFLFPFLFSLSSPSSFSPMRCFFVPFFSFHFFFLLFFTLLFVPFSFYFHFFFLLFFTLLFVPFSLLSLLMIKVFLLLFFLFVFFFSSPLSYRQ